jgi:WG containing repeat
MEAGFRWSLAALGTVLLANFALAQEQQLELTPAGNGTVALPPRYDWVGTFADGRAPVRLGGRYGFVDEDGREIVKPQYAIVDNFKFGFAQVDVEGKSGLIDGNGRMAVEPKYGFIEAIGRDRFRVSDERRLGGLQGGDKFSGSRWLFTASGGISRQLPQSSPATGVIDLSGQAIEPQVTSREFDDDTSLRWVQKDKLWGLQRADGTWLVEPKFERAEALSAGLARVTLNGKVGFIDRTGNFAIAPVFDKAWWFLSGFDRTSATRDGIVGVIDKTGAWVFQTDYQQVHFAMFLDLDRRSHTVRGWNFKKADRWGFLDVDGRVVLSADFDQPIQLCPDGLLLAYKSKERLYFKADGTPLQAPGAHYIGGACSPHTLRIGDKFGLVAADRTPLTPVRFDAITWAGQHARNVKIGDKWGRIGLDGQWLIEPKFDYISSEPDIFVAAIDGKRGFMRSDGTWLIEPRFDAARLRNAETAFVTVSGATGVLRVTDQSWIISPRSGIMCDIANAIMSEADGKLVVLSPAGEIWIDIGAERVGNNLALGLLTFLRNGKWGLVDTAGQVIVEPQYDEPVYFLPDLRGVAWAKRGERWCGIDRRGTAVPSLPCIDADPTGFTARGWFQCKVEH